MSWLINYWCLSNVRKTIKPKISGNQNVRILIKITIIDATVNSILEFNINPNKLASVTKIPPGINVKAPIIWPTK